MADRIIKPDSGNELVIEDAGSTDRLRITDGGSTILYEDGGTAALIIDTNGDIGIGTDSVNLSSAGRVLAIHSDTTYGALELRNHDATGTETLGRIDFLNMDGGSSYAAQSIILSARDGADDASNLTFYTEETGSSSAIRLRIDSNGQLYTPEVYNTTTSGSANTHIHSNGYLHRSTSSIKYKKDVETLEDSYANKILDLRPVWYRSKCKSDNPDWSQWGLIAEEVAEVDPRLVQWKTEERIKKENPETGLTEDETVLLDPPEAEGVQYERLVPHLINILKRMDTKIKILEDA